MSIATFIADLITGLYLIFAHWAFSNSVSGGTPQAWLVALSAPLFALVLLEAAIVGTIATFGMPNWRDRCIALVALLLAVGEFLLLRSL